MSLYRHFNNLVSNFEINKALQAKENDYFPGKTQIPIMKGKS